MQYIPLNSSTHLLLQPLDRKKTEIEIILAAGGSWFEDSHDRGKKHLLEHCIASRTKVMNFQELKDFQYRENIMLNAYTGPITMGLTASGHSSDFYKMIDLLLEMTFTPTFDQEILDREKEIVLREISERRGDPNYRLHFDIIKNIFTTDSYSSHEVLGDSDKVALTSLADFKKMHTQNLNQSHIIISISGGNIDQGYLTDKVEYYLKNTPELLGIENKIPVDFQADNTFLDFQILPIVHELAHSHAEVSVYLPCEVNFENKPALQIFENLFLKYGGVLYDRLRDELGLVYGIQSSFDYNMQVLEISLSCEIQYVEQIVDEMRAVFSNFEKNFNSTKFNEFKNIIQKKQDIAQDTLGAGTYFTQNILRVYGVPEIYENYARRLDLVSLDKVKSIYDYVQNNFAKMRVVIVSNNPDINELSQTLIQKYIQTIKIL